MDKKIRALALFSGGLDSLLAIKTIVLQDIDVVALHFDIGFSGISNNVDELEELINQIGATLKVIDIKDSFVKDILFDPKYGYGKNFNPCIDCHANMVRVAKAYLSPLKANFLISGEVVGQRPMSQRKEAMRQVEKLSDIDGLLLRPLSAKLLPPTIAEENGWVNREMLFDISGRSRIVQMELAKQYNIIKYPSPAGGCKLTDPAFSNRIKESIEFDKFESCDIDIVNVGRHFRLPDGAKLVIGRDHTENDKIENIDNYKYNLITLKDIIGPLSLISKSASGGDISLAMRLVCTYAKSLFGEEYALDMSNKQYTATPLKDKKEAREYLIT
jgi:tRNA-specific 2-thiouridylase